VKGFGRSFGDFEDMGIIIFLLTRVLALADDLFFCYYIKYDKKECLYIYNNRVFCYVLFYVESLIWLDILLQWLNPILTKLFEISY